MRIGALLISLCVALVVGFLVAVGMTALLDPVVWPSMLVGIPVGILAGGIAFALVAIGVAKRDKRNLRPQTG